MILVTTAQINDDHRWFCKSWSFQLKSQVDLGPNQYIFKSLDVPKNFYKKFQLYYVERDKLYFAFDKENEYGKIHFPSVPTNTSNPLEILEEWSYGGKILREFDEDGNPKDVSFIPPKYSKIEDGEIPIV